MWGNCSRTSAGHLREAGQLAVNPAKEAKEGYLMGMGLRSQVCPLVWLTSSVRETHPPLSDCSWKNGKYRPFSGLVTWEGLGSTFQRQWSASYLSIVGRCRFRCRTRSQLPTPGAQLLRCNSLLFLPEEGRTSLRVFLPQPV